MIVLKCASCGREWPASYGNQWGREQASDGLGPRPRCGNIVPNLYAPKASDGSVPGQLCGGDLVAIATAPAPA